MILFQLDSIKEWLFLTIFYGYLDKNLKNPWNGFQFLSLKTDLWQFTKIILKYEEHIKNWFLTFWGQKLLIENRINTNVTFSFI